MRAISVTQFQVPTTHVFLYGCRLGCPGWSSGRETGTRHAPGTSVFWSDLMLFPVSADLSPQLSNSGPAFKHWCVSHQSSLVSGESKSSVLLLNSHPQVAANGLSSTFPDLAKLSSFTAQHSWAPWGHLCRGHVVSELLPTLGHNFISLLAIALHFNTWLCHTGDVFGMATTDEIVILLSVTVSSLSLFLFHTSKS